MKIVLVHDADVCSRIEFLQKRHLLPLDGGILLVHDGEFDIGIEARQIEVRREGLGDVSFRIPFQGEGARLIFPLQVIQVEDLCKLFF